MQINSINNNQPNFGIKYVNKSAWNSEALKAFESSELLKGIDRKFPEASVVYSKTYNNSDKLHTLKVNFQLAKDYGFDWVLSSAKEYDLEKWFKKFVNEENLGSLEYFVYRQKNILWYTELY